MWDKSFIKEKSANDNENVVPALFLDSLRNIGLGKFKDYLFLGKSYENGYGIKKDLKKALEMYENYYEAHRRLVPSRFNLIEFLINIGNKYMYLGDKTIAADWYLKASMQIMEDYPNNEKQQQKVFKKYKIEKLLRRAGCDEIV